RGPVFFVQQRAGRYRMPFSLIKFRTMHPVEGRHSEWERDNSDRITRCGRWLRRFRLDELPQLINMLRGDMNLVGPRPHPMTNLELLVLTARNLSEVSGDAIPYYSLRCSVRPGITGWAQVRYRYANSLEQEVEKIRYDLYYLKHRSVRLDLRILVETIGIVVSGHRSAPAEIEAPPETIDARESA
ncbi:MAG: sugar transferase, partial [Candidatus Rokuibacteriota bacterium]